jgi:4-amino-4-deoxy-L-arabinose transferase-like glycosyltransferase
MKQRNYIAFIILLTLAYFPLFLHLDAVPLMVWDEARLAVSAFEMLQNHEYIVVTYGNKPDLWSVKPPLMIWLIALSFKTFGYNELALRLPSALAGLATIIVLFQFCKTFFKSQSMGLFSAFVLMTTMGYVEHHVTRTGDYDSLLILFQFSSYLYFIKHYFEKENSKRNLFLCALMLSLAIMTKGIAGLMLCLSIVLFILLEKKIISYLMRSDTYIALLIAFTPISIYLFLREKASTGYLNAVWDMELFNRFSPSFSAALANMPLNEKIQYYIGNIFVSDFTTWIFLFPVGVLSTSFYDNKGHRKALLLIVLNIIIFLFIITYSTTKNGWYDAPVYPFLAMIVGSGLNWLFLELKKVFNENTWKVKTGLITLFFIFLAYPYLLICQKFYIFTDDGWEWWKRQYRPFMLEQDPNLTYFILTTDYNAAVQFTVDVLNKDRVRIHSANPMDRVDFPKMKKGTKVMFAEKQAQDSLDVHYQYKILSTYRDCKMIEITENKALKK